MNVFYFLSLEYTKTKLNILKSPTKQIFCKQVLLHTILEMKYLQALKNVFHV